MSQYVIIPLIILILPVVNSLLLPQISYTVPSSNLGWKDDTTGEWFDATGARSGPPMNYWRQSMDERQYNAEMEYIRTCLEEGRGDEQLLPRPTISKPFLNRKLLQTWCPLLLSSHPLTPILPSPPVPNPTPTTTPRTPVSPPFLLTLKRTNGVVMGTRNHYGIFQAHLKQGELITATLEERGEGGNGRTVVFEADEGNRAVNIGTYDNLPVNLGCVTYLSSYVMVSSHEGLKTVWVKADKVEEGYESKTKEDDVLTTAAW